jgi:integrase
MSEFKSIFASELSEFLLLKKKTITKSSALHYVRILTDFDLFIADRNISEKIIKEPLVSDWIHTLCGRLTAKTVSNYVSLLRQFSEYLKFCGYPVFIPESLPKYVNNYMAYLFSDSEIEKIIRTADNTPVKRSIPSSRYNRYTFPMLLRMLIGCGLRLNETLSLKVGDVNFRDGVLLMRQTKNNKQRLVPMDNSLNEMLKRYSVVMGIANNPEAWLFPTDKPENHMPSNAAYRLFHNTLVDSGIYVKPEPHTRGQCLHCFRHLFTIKSFAKAECDGLSVSDAVPFLSVYLGHFDINGTERYLRFFGDMFPEHTHRFEDYADGAFFGRLV